MMTVALQAPHQSGISGKITQVAEWLLLLYPEDLESGSNQKSARPGP